MKGERSQRGRMTAADRVVNRFAGAAALAKQTRVAFLNVFALAVSLVGLCQSNSAAQAIALVVESHSSIHQQAALGFEEGFGEGRIEKLYLDSARGELETRFENIRRMHPALVIAIGTQAARAAQKQLPSVPLLYCLALRPVQNELVGADIGGVALDVEVSRQLESILQALPQVRRIGVVYDDLTSGALIQQAQHALSPKVKLIPRVARTPDLAAREIEDLVGDVLSKSDAFWVLWDPVVANPANFRKLVQLSLTYGIPLIAPARPFVEAGALMSVGPDSRKAGEQTGRIARQVLNREVRLSDLRALPARELVVTVNGEVARRLGIGFPRSFRREILLATGAP
jgi:ABC-type uncharacterized transport system substrate-binding protein